MKRIVSGGGVVGGISALLAVMAGSDEERALSIRAVMHKQYTVSNSPFVRIKKELNSDATDWEKVRDATKRFVNLATALEKNEPRWGEKESWKRLTGLHFGDAKAMAEAAEARDRDAVMVIHQRLATACKGCHNAHRFRGRD
jgi:cytochrome c556